MEKSIENQEIIDKINEFADKLEGEYLSEYERAKAEGQKNANKTELTRIYFYNELFLKWKNNLKLPMDNIYIAETETAGKKEIKFYKEVEDEETGKTTQELMATVKFIDGKNVVVFEGEYNTLNDKVVDKDLKSIVKDNGKPKAQLKQETQELLETYISKGEMNKDDVKELKQESKSTEELNAKIKLGIAVGTNRVLTEAETRGFTEFQGKSIAVGYSKEQHSYVAYDQKTGDVLMGPAVGYTKTASVQSPEGEISEERHSAMMQSKENSNKMITIKIGQYGDIELYETDRTVENDYVSRKMDTEGRVNHSDNNKKLREEMNKEKTLDNMGETIEIMLKLGVEVKKHPESYKITRAEMESMLDEMRMDMNLTQAELEEKCQAVAQELSSEERTLRGILNAVKEKDEQEKSKEREEEEEGRTPWGDAYSRMNGRR